jgi:thioredoxin-related protein
MNLLLLRFLKCFLLSTAILILSSACSTNTPHVGKSVYVNSENPSLDIQNALDKAKSSDKLLLVVMGAQWCHDSRGLAEKFEDTDLANLLSANYELVFVDVGYFKDLRDISQRFGQAHYYATPTVMIINAKTERLINAKDMHIWGTADSIPMSQYIDYFATYAKNRVPVFVPLPENQESSIVAFEQRHSQRLTDAYKVLVPSMKLEDKSGEASDLFIKQWKEVKKYRTSLQIDIQNIRQQVIESPYEPIVFPNYPPFSWETDT